MRNRYTGRRDAMGYRSPALRPACRNCLHAVEVPGRERRTPLDALDCRKGAFLVAPLGICDHHAPAEAARAIGD